MLVAGTFSGRGKLSPGDMEVNYELARDAYQQIRPSVNCELEQHPQAEAS
jgi:hypothetical protein